MKNSVSGRPSELPSNVSPALAPRRTSTGSNGKHDKAAAEDNHRAEQRPSEDGVERGFSVTQIPSGSQLPSRSPSISQQNEAPSRPLFSHWYGTAPVSRPKNKSLLVAFASIFSAANVANPTGIDFDAFAGKTDLRLKTLLPKNVLRSEGIKELRMGGYLEFKSGPLQQIMPKDELGRTWLSEINMRHLDESVKAGAFGSMIKYMRAMVDNDSMFVGFAAQNGSTIKYSLRQRSSRRIPMRTIHGYPQNESERGLARVSPATALALRCIHDRRLDLFEAIITIAPKTVILEACDIPINANIFGVETMIAIFQALTPPNGNAIKFDSFNADKSEATHRAVVHFLQFNSRVDLKEALPRSLKVRKGFSGRKDLLIQNPAAFIAEIAYLLDVLGNFKNPPERNGDDVKMIEVQERKTKESAWRVAVFLGAVISYAAEFERRVNASSAEAKRNIAAGINVISSVLGAAGSMTPLPQPVVDASKASVQTLSEIIAHHFGNIGEEYKPEVIATALRNFINILRDSSGRGLLVCGMETIREEQFELLQESERKSRRNRGGIFEKRFVEILSEQIGVISAGDLISSVTKA